MAIWNVLCYTVDTIRESAVRSLWKRLKGHLTDDIKRRGQKGIDIVIKMEVRMDDEKILRERKYRLEAVYEAVEKAYGQWNFKGEKTSSGSVMYKDNGSDRDLGRFFSIVNALKKQEWFMGNVATWVLYDSDDSDSPDDFATEDLIAHYAQKRVVGA